MGEIQLPPHWKVVKLREVCQFTSKPRGLKYSDYEKIPFIPMELIPIGSLYFDNFTWQDGLKITSGTYFENGDFLIAKITPSFENGKQGIIEYLPLAFGVATTEVIPIKGKSGLSNKEFLAYYLLRQDIRNELAQKMEGSTGRQRLSKSVLENVDVYLPSLPEQKTIAHTLRSIQKAKETRQRELELERERKAALMQYLFTHGTRNENREEKEIGEIPESWKLVRLDSLVEFLSGGTPAKNHPEWWQGSIPWVSTKDLKQPRLSDAIDHISKEGLENGSRLVSEKTLLVAVRGMCLAKNIPVAITEVSMAFNQDIKALVPSSQIEAEYLLCAIQYLKDYLLRFVGTSAHGTKRLPTSSLKTLPIPLPKIEEQQLIAKVLKFCDRKIQALEKEITLIDELFHAMLEQLMTGKISTQPLTETYV